MPWEMMHGSEEPHCSNKYHQFVESSQEKGLHVVPITTQVRYWDFRQVTGSRPCNCAVHLGLDIFLWMLFSLQLQNKKGHGRLQPSFRERAENCLLASYISPWTCLHRKLEWSLVGSQNVWWISVGHLLQETLYPPGTVRGSTRVIRMLRTEQSLPGEGVGYSGHDDPLVTQRKQAEFDCAFI